MANILFKCFDKNEYWTGLITHFSKYGNLYEIVIESRSRIHVIFGKTNQGNFACIPDFGVGCHLVNLNDEFWNTEMLIRKLGVVDGVTVASALIALKGEVNI
jgi:hypothetical protein